MYLLHGMYNEHFLLVSTSQQERTVALQKVKAGSMLNDGKLKTTYFGLKFITQGRSMDIVDPLKCTDGRDLYLT